MLDIDRWRLLAVGLFAAQVQRRHPCPEARQPVGIDRLRIAIGNLQSAI